MAFVKLDCGILDSTLWPDREGREIFITALLMAEPYELKEPKQAIKIRSLEDDDFIIPAGWYGFVPAASTGIARRAGIALEEGVSAIERLCAPEPESRTPDHEGRRMARIDGGFIILNFDNYRRKDYTTAERSRRYRERNSKKEEVTPVTVRHAVTTRDVTQAEVEVKEEAKAKALFTNSTAQQVERVKAPAMAHPKTFQEMQFAIFNHGGLDDDPRDSEITERFWESMEKSGWTHDGKPIDRWLPYFAKFREKMIADYPC